MKIKTQTSLRVRTSVKAGFPPGPCINNHNQTCNAK